MKHFYFFSFILLLTACSQSEQEQANPLVGEWQLASIESFLNGVPDEEGDTDDDTPVTYTFLADSTYLHQEDTLETGHWILDRATLHMQPTGTQTCHIATVEYCSADTLLIYLQDSIENYFLEERHTYIKK